MRAYPTEDEQYSLWMLLYQTRQAMQKSRKREMVRANIYGSHTAILYLIDILGEKATPAELARWLVLEIHSISELLTRMQKKGLVSKGKTPKKGRGVAFKLTEKGKEVLRKASAQESIHNIMSVLSDEQRQQLRSSLELLLARSLREAGMDNTLRFLFAE
ncbi:MAG: winged helix-turn-helix transcriptional regulator [Chloroflexi bacterium]|nr:winged helix-turn-helix transcriptional regulator [Chloroflexota bacterium]